jgi:signal-transduction protein with cAMP-binding, CBS, and nucleotidyltransferase domain
VLAIRYGLEDRSTQERLRRLIELGKGSEPDLRAVIDAHEIAVGLILRQQVRDTHSGVPPSNRIKTAWLTKAERAELKVALQAVLRLDVLVREMLF